MTLGISIKIKQNTLQYQVDLDDVIRLLPVDYNFSIKSLELTKRQKDTQHHPFKI